MEARCQAPDCDNLGVAEYQGYCEPHWQAFAGVVLTQLFQAALAQQHHLSTPTATSAPGATLPFGFLNFECLQCGRRFVSREEAAGDSFCVVSYHPGEFQEPPSGPEKEAHEDKVVSDWYVAL